MMYWAGAVTAAITASWSPPGPVGSAYHIPAGLRLSPSPRQWQSQAARKDFAPCPVRLPPNGLFGLIPSCGWIYMGQTRSHVSNILSHV